MENSIRKLLEGKDKYWHKRVELDAEWNLKWERFLAEEGHRYGTPTSYSIKLLKDGGFNPVAITHYYGEESFFFESEEEALEAYQKMEVETGEVVGWFHTTDEIQNLKNPDGTQLEVQWIQR